MWRNWKGPEKTVVESHITGEKKAPGLNLDFSSSKPWPWLQPGYYEAVQLAVLV